LPGDSLYPLKRVVEDISVYLVRNREIRQEYENTYSKQRVDEINRLIMLNRKQQISFEGVLESQNDTNWMVSGISVILQANTTFIGGGEKVGLYDVASVVEVEGITNSEGGVTAIEIHLREYQFFGIVETIRSNFWQISGLQVVISSQTQIEEGIRVGDNVTVLMRSEDDGLYALAILREEHRVINPIIQQSPGTNQAVSGDITAEVEELHQIVGTLEKTSDSYWVVNGQYVYIVGNSNIPTDIIVGDSIRVNYRIEANGSDTALDIKRVDDENQLLENELQGTPEIGHESKCQETSIVNSPNDDEKNEGTATPEDHEKSEPTGEYEHTP